jgi:fatty acid desaturase
MGENILEMTPSKNFGENQAIGEMLNLLKGQFRHQPHLYFLDVFLSAVLGYGGAILYLRTPWSSPLLALGACLASAYGLFRLGIFLHEIVHMPKGQMKVFKVFWNMIAGIPLGMPHFLFLNHAIHHGAKTYGTKNDGEYLPLGKDNGWKAVMSILQIPLVLVLTPYRFLILVPVTLIIPGGRRWLLKNASAFTMIPFFRYEKLPAAEPWWLWADLAASAWLWMVSLFFWTGTVSMAIAFKFQILVLLGIGLNGFRNLFAHTYRGDGQPVSHLRQFEDSITIQAPWFVETLFFPVGLKYHALHHLFPTLPYHQMKKVHQLLLEKLPATAPYRRNESRPLRKVFKELFFPKRGQFQR